jgi:hypothetical protein
MAAIKGTLLGEPTPGFAALHLTTEVSVVDFDAAGESAGGFAQAHDFHDLALEEPGGGVGDPEVALEPQRRDAVLACVIRCMARN